MRNVIDLRSDTVTKPTTHMQEAIFRAELGDDGYEEDPTINILEEIAADVVGKEAALLMPSGTMGNLTAIMTHTQNRKSEIIAEFYSHILNSEAAGYAHIAGAGVRGIKSVSGILDPEEVEACVRTPGVIHQPRTALICVENTHNYYGGTVVPVQSLYSLKDVADRHKIPMHLDGARIFNAACALNVDVKELTAPFDSVMFCLSKGLSAPVGSILAGDKCFIQEARHYRKILGGGMRQGGIIAAAGIIALKEMTNRLGEDNLRARKLAEGLSLLPGIKIDLSTVQTNIVRVNTKETGKKAARLTALLREEGVLCNATGMDTIRLVTHRHITDQDVRNALNAFEKVIQNPDEQGAGREAIY